MREEKAKAQLNTMQSTRSNFLIFIIENNYKCGLNNISNCMRSVTNVVKKDWMLVDKNAFKTLCKKHVIQEHLMLS